MRKRIITALLALAAAVALALAASPAAASTGDINAVNDELCC